MTLSSNDYSIRLASARNTLKINEIPSRFGGTFFAICDEFGVIEVTATKDEADALIFSALR